MFDYPDAQGRREVYQPLADELLRQQEVIAAIARGETPRGGQFDVDNSALDWAAHVMEERTDEAPST